MANFAPFNNYLLFCLDRLIDKYNLLSPFLDVGCGSGYVSRHFALKEWVGKSIDFSHAAISKAKENLAVFKQVELKCESLSQTSGVFNTVFCIDVLEHVEDETFFLRKIYSLLSIGGFLIVAVPSNYREWRWDDEFYGHYRRYDSNELQEKLTMAGLNPIVCWDMTYPVFWMMRRVYIRLKFYRKERFVDKTMCTMRSSLDNAWEIPLILSLLLNQSIFWDFIYRFQFRFFRKNVARGNQIIVLARKIN